MAGAALAGARLDDGAVRVYSDAGDVRVAVVDYGCKRSILRRLAGAGARRDRLPARRRRRHARRLRRRRCSRTARATPSRSTPRSRVVRELLGRVPVLGICLGHQLLALATGLRDVQAARSATAARTIRCSSARPAACS